jgi:hypothetical protein
VYSAKHLTTSTEQASKKLDDLIDNTNALTHKIRGWRFGSVQTELNVLLRCIEANRNRHEGQGAVE